LSEAVRVGAVGQQDVSVVQEAVNGCGGEGLGHQLVEACGMDVRRQRDRAFLIGGIDDPKQGLAASGATGSIPMSSITIRSPRMSRPIALLTLSSARWRRSNVARLSSVCQATVLPASIARCPSASAMWLLPVPDGPQMQFSARAIHSSVLSACCVAAGIGDAASFHVSNVLPAGSCDSC
jgi:hypothetical protein